MKNRFVETSNFTRLEKMIQGVVTAAPGMPPLAVVSGRLGLGKTLATDRVAVFTGGVYVRAVRGITPAALLRAILTGMGEKPSWDKYSNLIRAVEILRQRDLQDRQTALIMMDEADYLLEGATHERFPATLDTLRDLADMAHCPILLVGEPELADTIQRFAKSNRFYRRFWDRVLDSCEFKPLGASETARVALELAELELSPEAAEIARVAVEGNLRRLVVALHKLDRVCRASRTKEVSAELLARVFGWVSEGGASAARPSTANKGRKVA